MRLQDASVRQRLVRLNWRVERRASSHPKERRRRNDVQSTSFNVYYLLWYAHSIPPKAYHKVVRHQTAAAQESPSLLWSQDYRRYKYDTGICCYHTLRFSIAWVLESSVSRPRHIGWDVD
jgi:hypothetical protein